jgi:hypothetical protein
MVDSERIIGPDEIVRLCGVRNILKQIAPTTNRHRQLRKQK